MVLGVSQGFTRTLEIEGVGYRAEMQDKKLVLHLGYSHPVVFDPPDGVALDGNSDVDYQFSVVRATAKWKF
jgi:large subunit ribosomal protein L6